ncbi:unnamed protein product [Brassicogethes aeneus]|uniref:Uncharacterized protein n=1 Tax=Brassicogethes aeneus TaxID=1431903 RepID=A0A9P0B0J0_BRAAE|nr:unnamed protein product [Brassicogethes aeneus]
MDKLGQNEINSQSDQPDPDVKDALASFREKWQKELRISNTKNKSLTHAEENPEKSTNNDLEEKAKSLFLKGIEMERSGKLYEAIQFYRRAVQIVPDIEFRLDAPKGSKKEKTNKIEVNVFLKIVTAFIKSLSNTAKKIFYFSDGAPQQFKNYKNFVNLYYHKEDFGINAEWHFFASYHGKGPCDGVGGTLKRGAARASLQLPFDKQISNPRELYQWAAQSNNLPKIEVRYSTIADYEKATENLNIRYSKAKSITDTQKYHCVIPNTDGSLTMKLISCSNKTYSCKIFKRQKK